MHRAGSQPLSDLLRAEAARRGLSQTDIAEAVGVSQPQVSRILAGKFTRVSGRVIQVCKFLELDGLVGSGAVRESKRLAEAVLEAWDGTKSHEEALVRLLSALKAVIR